MLTVGADVGKSKTKIKWKGGVKGYNSSIATYREINDSLSLDENNIVFEYKDKLYFAGDLAEREGQNFLNSPEMHKSNIVTLFNLLIGLSQLPAQDFNVIVGNPFGVNTAKERQSMKDLFIGIKEFKVNNRPYRINIRNVGIAPEGAAAWYSDPQFDDCNIFDFGSTTIHAIAMRKKRLIDRRSHTFEFGFETLIDHNYEGLMLSLKNQMEKKWNDGNKKLILVGGKAPDMLKYVRELYPNSNATIHNNYEFANAIGLYEMGVVAYERAAN